MNAIITLCIFYFQLVGLEPPSPRQLHHPWVKLIWGEAERAAQNKDQWRGIVVAWSPTGAKEWVVGLKPPSPHQLHHPGVKLIWGEAVHAKQNKDQWRGIVIALSPTGAKEWVVGLKAHSPHQLHHPGVKLCLVLSPQYYASVSRFGSRGPGWKVCPRQKSEKWDNLSHFFTEAI